MKTLAVVTGVLLACLAAGCTCQIVEYRGIDGVSLTTTRAGWGYNGFSPVNISTLVVPGADAAQDKEGQQ